MEETITYLIGAGASSSLNKFVTKKTISKARKPEKVAGAGLVVR